jgi:hypothetical protein
MSNLISLAAGDATRGVCVPQLKALQRAAAAGMTSSLTFAVAPPAKAAANIEAMVGVVNAVTTVIHRQSAIVDCLIARA